MIKIKNKLKTTSLLLLTFITPLTLLANNKYVPLSPSLPGVDSTGYTYGTEHGMSNFINNLFGISVGVAAVLAVIMLAIGGFQYMTSESIFKTSGAKERITNAIVGLIIVLASILIMSTINPDIVNLHIFQTGAGNALNS